ncbi:MAG: DUF222 domain-containing protein, partial [Acidimicrobiales bacterium]
MELEVLSQDLKALFDEGPVSDPESVAALLGLRSQFDAYVTASVGEFDKWGAWALDGARSAAAWVAARGKLARVEARRLVRRGRALDHLPASAEAWRQGDIGAAHVDTLERARNPRTRDCLERDEKLLVDCGSTLGPEHFGRAVAYWCQLADPDGTEESAE